MPSGVGPESDAELRMPARSASMRWSAIRVLGTRSAAMTPMNPSSGAHRSTMRRRRSALTEALSSWCPWSGGRVSGEAPSLVIRHSPRRYRTQRGACRDVPRSPAHTGRLLSGRNRNQGGRSMVKFSRRSLLQAAAATTGGVVLSGGLDRMIVQAAGGKPAKLAPAAGRRPARRDRTAQPAVGLPVSIVPRHRRAGDHAQRWHRAPRPT